ncbi:MAG: CCA tRNA nucleotidyltransferase [Actinobacteria bacterium]|nr:CCA tRNA nucleotidyltransferase [Actinomycetota bacterium]
MSAEQHALVSRVVAANPVIGELGERFTAAGFELSLVGGSVRDALLGRLGHDLDFTTNARPDDITKLITGWADAIWDVGREFGTIAARHGDFEIEITTYRTDAYDPDSRKPAVEYGDTLVGDLGRRDFTVNSMAFTLGVNELVDPFNGTSDLQERRLMTPAAPEQSFSDDPLRMMRAARFAAQLGFDVAADVVTAMTAMNERISIISAERVRDEIIKLVMADFPRKGLELLGSTGLAAHVLPEIVDMKTTVDEHNRHKDVYEHTLMVVEQAIDLEKAHEPTSGPDFILRFAALMHDIGKPKTRRFEGTNSVTFHHHEVVGAKMTRKRMKALRFSNDEIDQVSTLVELHLRFHGYGSGEWTDSAVRRYVRDAGDQLVRLHKLTRADCTTRNARKAAALARTYDSLEARIADLAAHEELASIRPDLDGEQIMEILGIGPGREVGQAYRFLLDLRLDRGPLEPDVAKEALLAWWAART